MALQESRLGREGLRPAASPVDTFVQPAKETSLLALADGLSNFAPVVGRVSEAIREKSLRIAAERGAEDTAAAIQSGETPGDVVSRINPAASSAYKEAAKKQAAQLAAFNYGSALNKHMTENLNSETDLDSFNAKVDEFSKEWEANNTPEGDGEFFRHFSRQAAVLRANNVAQMSWRIGERKRLQTEEEFGAVVAVAVKAEYDWTKEEGREGRVHQAVSVLRERAFRMGIPGSRINELIFENVSSQAIADGNPDLAEALYMVPTGQDGKATLGGIPAYGEKIARAYHAAELTRNNMENADKEKKKGEPDKIRQSLNTFMLDAIEGGQDPARVNITPFLRAMNDVDSQQVDDLIALKQSHVQNQRRTTLPAIEQELSNNIYNPEIKWGHNELFKAWRDGGMSTDTYNEYRKKIDQRDQIRATRKGADPDTLMAQARRVINENIDALNLGDGARVVKGQLQRQLREQMYEWLATEDGKKANPAAVKAHATELADSLTVNYKP
jgi:hypothetical protein